MEIRTARNRSRETLLASQCGVADTGWARMKGLLGRRAEEFCPGKGLWLVPANAIHTIGMLFPIDAAYLDGKGRVIHLCHRLAPYRLGAVKLRAKSVLELPAGTLERTRTGLGDVIEFRSSGRSSA
jgi:hypothetical protein